jgi:hypothetical protein
MIYGLMSQLATCCMLVSCFAFSSAMKIKTVSFWEISFDFQWTTRHYITYVCARRTYE